MAGIDANMDYFGFDKVILESILVCGYFQAKNFESFISSDLNQVSSTEDRNLQQHIAENQLWVCFQYKVQQIAGQYITIMFFFFIHTVKSINRSNWLCHSISGIQFESKQFVEDDDI